MSSNWVVDLTVELKKFNVSTKEQEKQWNKPSIYKLSAASCCLTGRPNSSSSSSSNQKAAAYLPQIVSFGPYHHDDEHLRNMECHKHRALHHFLLRSDKTLQTLVDTLILAKADTDIDHHHHHHHQAEAAPVPLVQQLMDSYDSLDHKWRNDQNEFVKLMILDGCFMLEVLQWFDKAAAAAASHDHDHDQYFGHYARNDPIFSHHGKLYFMSYMRRDMLMLENQLPMPLLKTLLAFETCKSKFEISNSSSLKDISFQGQVLRLPVVVIDDTTESTFLNLMAFERFHVGAGNEITSYVCFMDNIIDSAEDVKILKCSGIVHNAIGSEKAVAKLFNEMTKDVTPDPGSSLEEVERKLNDYCKNKWHEWRANLIHTYFRSPWALLSLLAAVVLLALTISQTFYTIYPYYHPAATTKYLAS
ncbi:Protein of unknown function DUF247 [Macleaya cordata]|uniref:Uncharacterized protein n=1 Tax=Macleaya cordata TaxID=56857 RepID=A0A200PY00_MACCD|nr:Protein of unknown function DUF247 [Macleaya cordata]